VVERRGGGEVEEGRDVCVQEVRGAEISSNTTSAVNLNITEICS